MNRKVLNIKNYQEDIVYSAIEITLRESYPNLSKDQKSINDIAAFVLNRLPPRYITSGRGMSHLCGSILNDPAETTTIDVVMLINFAIQTILGRRNVGDATLDVEDEDVSPPFIIFPQIIGYVTDHTTRKPLEQAEASIASAKTGDLLLSMKPGWDNPSHTNKLGSFCIWPRYLNADADYSLDLENIDKPFSIHLSITSQGYTTFKMPININTRYCLYFHEIAKLADFHNLGEIALQKNNA